MTLKIYVEGNVTPESAKTGWISADDDHTKRSSVIRPCVDGFLQYEANGQKGILLAYRDNTPPTPNQVWVPGGEWKRGIMDPAEALRIKIKEETGLDITDAEQIGAISVLWEEGPYNAPQLKEERKKRNLGEGIHEFGLVYFAKAKGNLKLKSMREPILLVTPENYDEVMDTHNAHDYIRYFTKEALKKIN